MPPSGSEGLVGAHGRVNIRKSLYGKGDEGTPSSSESFTPHARYEGAAEAFHDEAPTPKLRAPGKTIRTKCKRTVRQRPKMMWHHTGALRRDECVKQYLERLEAQRKECLRRGDEKREQLRRLRRCWLPEEMFMREDARDSFINAAIDRYYTHLLPLPLCVYEDGHTHPHSKSTGALWCVGDEHAVCGVDAKRSRKMVKKKQQV